MKGAFEDNMEPVPSCAADSDRVAGQTKQAIEEVNRNKARTSVAMLGLAISMGASNLLVPQQGEAAVSNHLPPTDRENWMPAAPIADFSSNLDPAYASPVNGSQISETLVPQQFGGLHQTDEPNFNVREIGAIGESNNQLALNENLSSIETEAFTEAQMGKPEPSFLVASASSDRPEFLFPGNSKTTTNKAADVPSLNHLPVQDLGMAPIEVTVATAPESSQKTIIPGSETYTPDRNDSIELPETLIDTDRALLNIQQNSAKIQAGINSELDAPQVNIEYTNQIPVSELFPTEAIRTVDAATESSIAPEVESATLSEELMTRDSEMLIEPSIELEPVAFPLSATPLPIESNPDYSEIVAYPDLTNAVVIESAPAAVTASRIYKVDTGETLDTIAQKNNLSVDDLMAANQIRDPNFIKAQQKIKVPLIERQNSTILENVATDRSDEVTAESSVHQLSAPVVLGTDAIYPLAPTGRNHAKALVDSPTGSIDSPQNMGSLPSGTATKNPYANSLNADLEKLREKYPIAKADNKSYPEAALPIDSAWQTSNRVVISVPDLLPEDRLTGSQLEIAPASQYLASENSEEISQNSSNAYVEGLRADIERLRQNQEDREAAKVQSAANENHLSENFSEQFTEIYSEQSSLDLEQYSEESNQVLQAAIENKPEKHQSPTIPSPENTKPTQTEEKPTSQDLLATGSSGTAAYQPLLQPASGQMVSPQLPPLNSPDSYLPNSPAIFNGYIWPANGIMTSGYGWRWGRMHNGIDIAGPVGTPIFAAASGTVTYAGWHSGGYGNLVEIEHADGSFTLYAHNHRILVREGQEVDQGVQVAEMGSTGFSTGPHLHFEIHPSGQPAVNPMAYLPRE